MREDNLRRTEQLLREAADWEPRKAMPPALTIAALEAALERERLESRRTPRTPIVVALVFGGGALTSAVAGALWALMMPHGSAYAPVATPGRPHPQLAAYSTQPAREDPAAAPPVPVRVRPATPLPQLVDWTPQPRHQPGAYRLSRSFAQARRAPRAVWTTQEVERKHNGLLAPGLLVQPDPNTQTVYLHPGVVDIPLPDSRSACTPLPPDQQQNPNEPLPDPEQEVKP